MFRDSDIALLSDVARGRVSRRDLIKRGAALGLGTSALATLVGVHETAAQDGGASGDVTFALDTAPPNIAPFGGISQAQQNGAEFMYDSLLEWDQDLIIQPALAESWETPDDTSYVFTLRQGVMFHDGRELTSADVVYSIENAVSPPEPGIAIGFLANIAGAEAIDDYTVQINMSQVDPTLIGVLAWARYTPIVPEGMLEELNSLTEGIGTGPFRLTEYVQDDVIVYEAFGDYWKDGVPCIANLTLKSLPDAPTRLQNLRSGEIDGGTISADQVITVEGDDNIEVLRGLTASTRVMHFNTVEDVPWRDIRVRQAINKVVDRQRIIDNVYAGEAVITGPVPPGYGEFPLPEERLAELYAQDVEEAKRLMEEAGYADGFSVELQSIAQPAEYTQIAEVIREQVAELNIDATVQPLEIGTFAENIGDGSFQWASTARGMRGDPSGFVIDFRQGTNLNVAWFGDGWNNDEINELYDQALTELDQDARVPLYHQMQELILEEAANIYTVQSFKFQGVQSRLDGMYVDFDNSNSGLRTACVVEE